MDQGTKPSEVASEPVTVSDVLQVVRQEPRALASIVILCVVAAVGYAFLAEPLYRAEVTLIPATTQGSTAGGSLVELAQEFGALSPLAGLTSTGASKSEALATLESRRLTEQFVSDHNLLPTLFERQWDGSSGSWKVGPDEQPTLWHADKLFRTKIRRLVEDRKTGVIKLSIDWKDPDTAAAWANELVQRANDALRARALVEAERNIAFLERELKNTAVVELQQSIYRLLERQLTQMMLAKGNDQYAFRIIDPARPPREKHWPRRAMIAVVGGIVGLFAAFVYAFYRAERKAFNVGALSRSREDSR